MTSTEILVLVVGLGLGYWLVSLLMSTAKLDGPPTEEVSEPPFNASATEGGKDCYEVLGIFPIASREQVAAAYKLKIGQYHPDKVATMGPEIRHLAQLRSSEINVAYREAMKRFG